MPPAPIYTPSPKNLPPRYSAVLVALILLRLTARYALEMSPSKCCSSKGLFPWTLCLLYVGALFAPILSLWWRFPPPLYDFDGAFRPPNSESGGTFCPHSRYVAKIQFRFTIHTNWSYHTAFIIFSTSFFLDSHITLSSYLSKILLISFRFLFWKVSVHFKRL